MSERIFAGIFDAEGTAAAVSVTDFLICLGVSLLLGFLLAASYIIKMRYTKSFVVTLSLLPAVVAVVIIMVNGNIGAGVAVAGTFSLVRFRSAPGTAKEIVAIFLAMGTGLVCGMGYLGYAALFTLIMCAVFVGLNFLDFGKKHADRIYRTVKITIPEDLDYTEAFSDVFAEFTSRYELAQVKTTNMGSMFRLTYDVTLRRAEREKDFIDALRTRNGNLEIMVSKQETHTAEL